MHTLYIAQQGAVLRRTGQRLIVDNHDGTGRTARLRDVERVVLAGNIQITASAQTALLASNIDTILLSQAGQLRGRLAAPWSRDVFLRQAQFKLLDARESRLEIARRIVSGKLRNARRIVTRYMHNHASDTLSGIADALQSARARSLKAGCIAQLLGIEGDAAHRYFSAYAQMIIGGLEFRGRSRRPPRDPVNAMMSFGYALLSSELVGILSGLGLDPAVGILHDLDYGRPSLALDLLEEFRPALIDRLVLKLVNRKEMNSMNFEGDPQSGVLLAASGRERFIAAYGEMLESPPSGREATVRSLLLRQAKRLRESIKTGALHPLSNWIAAAMRYVMVYDVSVDKRRNRIAKLLLDYGDRVQYSVFEAELHPGDVDRIIERATVILNETSDSLRIYALCEACFKRLHVVGKDTGPDIPEGWVVLD